jgi:2-polyprenyl-3-methyl-5-hydroxy-6-metoxy-1,4-benzoquinol methylase
MSDCPVCLNPSTSPALAGSDVLFETSTREFKLNGCRLCNSLFINPLPDEAELETFYPTQYWWSASHRSLLKRAEAIYRRIALHGHIAFITSAAARLTGRRPLRLLDVGCGNAMLLGLLKRRGFDVLGVDTSSEAAEVAASENGVRVVVGTLHGAGFADTSFDLVTLFHVMEHVTNPHEVLAEVHRTLQPDGTIVLQVPNIDSWQFRWFGARWYGLDIPRHVIDYSRQSIVKLLQDSRFRIVRIRHFNLRDNAPALISSLFPSLDPLSRPIRLRRRNARETMISAWSKHVLYFALVIFAYPLCLIEAAFGRGATVMIEARK